MNNLCRRRGEEQATGIGVNICLYKAEGLWLGWQWLGIVDAFLASPRFNWPYFSNSGGLHHRMTGNRLSWLRMKAQGTDARPCPFPLLVRIPWNIVPLRHTTP